MKVFFIHGANASALSFTYLKTHLQGWGHEDIGYDHQTPVTDTAKRLVGRMIATGGKSFVVGHSLGGVIGAIAALDAPDLFGGLVTISSPFGGSVAAGALRWIQPCQIFEDIQPGSPVVRRLAANQIKVPALSIVTTGGRTMFGEASDGVVTVTAQKALDGTKYSEYRLNHFEALLSPDVGQEVCGFLKRLN